MVVKIIDQFGNLINSRLEEIPITLLTRKKRKAVVWYFNKFPTIAALVLYERTRKVKFTRNHGWSLQSLSSRDKKLSLSFGFEVLI